MEKKIVKIRPAIERLRSTSTDREQKKKPVACAVCRKRKIKCSNDRPACTNCIRFSTPCLYPMVRNKGSRYGYREMLEKRVKSLEKYINQQGTVSPFKEVEIPDVSMSQMLRQATSSSPFEHLPATSLSSAPSSAIPNGITSSSSLQKTSDNITSKGDSEFPSREVIFHLVDVYFKHIHNHTYSFLHEKLFMYRLSQDQVRRSLVLAICALSARFSTHVAVATPLPFNAGERLVNKAKQILNVELDDPSLETVQAMILIIQHDFFRARGNKALVYVGLTGNLVTDLKLNVDDLSLSWIERESRRRTYWSLILIDRYVHSSPYDLKLYKESDVLNLPLPCADWNFIENVPVSVRSISGCYDTSSHYPRGEPGLFAYHIQAVLLWSEALYFSMSDYKETIPPWHEDSQYSKLNAKLEAFEKSLPQEFVYSRQTLAKMPRRMVGQFVHINAQTNMARSLLNRTMFPYRMSFKDPPKEFLYKTAHGVSQSATNITQMCQDIFDLQPTLHVAPFVAFCVFSSSSAHIASACSDDPQISEHAKRSLATNVKFLVSLKSYWYAIGVWCVMLKAQYKQRSSKTRLSTTTPINYEPLEALSRTTQMGSALTSIKVHDISRTNVDDDEMLVPLNDDKTEKKHIVENRVYENSPLVLQAKSVFEEFMKSSYLPDNGEDWLDLIRTQDDPVDFCAFNDQAGSSATAAQLLEELFASV